MKKFLVAALLALPLTALGSAQAHAGDCCTPLYRVGISVGLVFRGWCGCDYSCCKQKAYCGPCGKGGGGGGGGASFPGGGPWYGAWPYNAHFQTPAPTGYPFWPAPMTYSGHAAAPMPGVGGATYAAQPMEEMGHYGHAAMAMPPQGSYGAFPVAQGMVQPAGYYNHQGPSYWYNGR
jgi:hypothetical protein